MHRFLFTTPYAKITILEFEGVYMISFFLTAKRLLEAILVAVKDKVFILHKTRGLELFTCHLFFMGQSDS